MIKLNYSYDHEKLKEVQNELFKILLSFDKLSKEHNLKYQLYAGTLIGAIRHKNFIPWDDDLDIVMTRSDFERLEFILNNENANLEITYNLQWVPRLKFKNNDLYIDIFIFDKRSNNIKRQKRNIFKLKFYQGMLKPKISFKNKGLINNILQVITFTLGKLFTHKYKLKRYIKLSTKFNNDINNINYYISNEAFHYLNINYESNWVNDLIKNEFNNHLFYISKHYDLILTIIYGNYLLLPEISKRVPEHLDIFKIKSEDNINENN